MSRLVLQRWLIGSLAALALSACSAHADGTGASTPGGGIGVLDGGWVLASQDRLIVLDVDDATSTVTVHTDCNDRFGSYTLDPNGTASFSLPGATKRACEDGATKLEQTTVETLEDVTSWTLEDDDLSLTGPHQTLTFHPAG